MEGVESVTQQSDWMLHGWPQSPASEKEWNAGIVERRVRGVLEWFERFIEARGVETGAWRGEIDR